MALADVSKATGLARAVVRRYLLTLVDLGYVRTDGRLFSLRPRVLETGYSFLSSLSLTEIARPHLEALVSKLNESASMSVLDGADIVYVVRVPARRIMSVTIAVGTHFPAYATSMGRVLLASRSDAELARYLAETDLKPLSARTITDQDVLKSELLKVRRQGWSGVDQELEEGLRSVAVPVLGARQEAIAAINTSVHMSRAAISELVRDVVPELKSVAAEISRAFLSSA